MSLCLVSRLSPILLVAVAATGLTGCNLQSSAVPSETAMPAMRGTVMGGETPIIGANVILWQTSSGGYGSSSAAKLGSTSTDNNGNFTFTTGYTCAGGQYVYVTSTGGNVSGSTTSPIINNNVVLVAALGSCSNFSSGTAQGNVRVVLNELSTVAAAYALGSFIAVNENTGSPGNQLVYIGAPANNNAATGTCTGTGSAMTCTAAGLGHAFANAANLVDAVHYNATTPTGAAFTTVPGNSLGSVPQAEINSLGDVMQYCTNSSGGAAGDSSPCGNYFTAATPSGGTAPTDTLTAMIDIAKNPRNNIGSIFGYIPSIGAAFGPALSAQPHDWDIAITFTGLVVGSTSTNFGNPAYLTLDANDNVYVAAANNLSASATTSGMMAMTSAGGGLWANAQSNLQCQPGTLATDTNGNVWETISPTSSAPSPCYYAIYGYNATTGATVFSFYPGSSVNGGPTDAIHSIQSAPTAIAFDRFNNLWYARKSSSCTMCLFEFVYTSGSPGTYAAPSNIQDSLVNVLQMLIDPSSNIYMSDSSTDLAYVLQNTGTVAAPTYAATPGYLSGTLGGSAAGTGGLSLDASGNIWASMDAKLTEFTGPITSSTGSLTQAASSPFSIASVTSTSTSPSKPYPGEIDGAGVYWYSSFTSSGQLWYTQLSSNTSDYLYTCYAPSGGTTCSNLSASGGAPSTTTASTRVMQVDSSGAVWVAGQGTSGTSVGAVVQILGAGTPTWPQISYGVFATKPQ